MIENRQQSKALSTLIISHDAGGARQLAYWCQKNRHHHNFSYALSGPAVKIFETVVPDSTGSRVDGLATVEATDIKQIITSTGWQSTFELDGIIWAGETQQYCVSYLDHWVNYPARFMKENKLFLPQELWVPDKDAAGIAQIAFNHKVKVTVVPNEYEAQVLKAIRSKLGNSVLICMEPVRNIRINLRQYYQNLCVYLIEKFHAETDFIIRPHPAVGLDDLTQFIVKQLGGKFHVMVSNSDLSEDLNQAHTVIGYQSSVFILAHKAGRQCLSFYPKALVEPLLPHGFIDYIDLEFAVVEP